MKILLISIGTRGDVEPFLAIGQMMHEHGHEVFCAVPEQFKSDVEEAGLEFRSMGPEFMEIVLDEDGRRILNNEGTWLQYLSSLFKHFKKHSKNGKNLMARQYAYVREIQPDHIVHSGLAYYPFMWEQDNKRKTTLLLPVPFIIYPTRQNSHVFFNVDWGSMLNRFSYKIANWHLALEIKNAARIQKIPFRLRKFHRDLLTYPSIFSVSPSLIPPISYPTAKVLGFRERKKSSQWQPSAELLNFLDRHDKVLLISFGSMGSNHPVERSNILVHILEKNKIPAILVKAGGGLTDSVAYNEDLIIFQEKIPYNWILPKIYGIIHHGGSGTTHSGLRHGCATLIIPHIFDQFMWNKIISKKKLGPNGIKVSKISVENLEPLILDLYHNPVYKENAVAISRQMKEENDPDEIVRFIMR